MFRKQSTSLRNNRTSLARRAFFYRERARYPFPRSNSFNGLPQSLTNITYDLANEPFLARRIGSSSKADLATLLESANLNDHGEEEYEGSGPEPDKGAVEEMVDAVRQRDNYLFYFLLTLTICFQFLSLYQTLVTFCVVSYYTE